MPTVAISWEPAARFDIHVLRGRTSRRLDLILHLNQHNDSQPTAADRPLPADVDSVRFVPRLRAPNPGDRVITAHGVQVDTETGQVEALAAPAPPLRAVSNFLIEARVTRNDPGSTVLTTFIRVHVHSSLAEAWLTPSPLSIRPGAPRHRFAVLGRFDDQVTGALTSHPGITWDSLDTGTVVVGPDNGQLAVAAQPASALTQIIATLPADLDGRTATGEVRVLGSWSTLPITLRTAQLVPGCPGSAARNDVINVLFVSEGFVSGERTVFRQVVEALAGELRTSVFTRPYDLVGKAINYWWVFLPAPGMQGGVSTLMELDVTGRPGGLTGTGVDPPQEPGPTDAYSLAELIFEVGLPVPADATVGLEAKRAEWAALFRVTLGRITAGVFRNWRRLHDRRLANEVDSALGLRIGDRPCVEDPDEGNTVTYSDLRTTREQLDQFLATLVDPVGVAIGDRWDSRQPGTAKDRSLVFALCGGAIGAGSATPAADERHTDLVAAGLVSTSVVALSAMPGSRQVTIGVNPVPRNAAGKVEIVREVLAVVTHEMTHAMPLGDEYSVSAGTLPLDRVDAVRLLPNVQDEVTLLDLATGRISGEQVKWRWPRLTLAGRVAAQPTDEGGGLFTVPLSKGHGAPFGAGDVVHLRKPLTGGIGRNSLSVPLEVVDQTDDTLVVLDVTGTLRATDFPATSVLCTPAPARPSARAKGDLHAELLDQVIRAHLNAEHTPLNRRLTPPQPCGSDDRATQPPRNLPDGLARGRPRPRSAIIGLYDGGEAFSCGVFHPSGRCLMRDQNLTTTGRILPFCHVCQYAIVDRLDPSRHADLGQRINDDVAQP